MSATVFVRCFMRHGLQGTGQNLLILRNISGQRRLVFNTLLPRMQSAASAGSAQTCLNGGPSPVLQPLHHVGLLQERCASDFAGAPPSNNEDCTLTEAEYEEVCEETLQSLADRFEDLAEGSLDKDDYDLQYAGGVVTFHMGTYGTYVINKQTPNKQIWLSSPSSGPKRYDYRDGVWIYKHDGISLHTLLSKELSDACNKSIDLSECSFARVDKA